MIIVCDADDIDERVAHETETSGTGSSTTLSFIKFSCQPYIWRKGHSFFHKESVKHEKR
jgi:hypothetical protein